MSSGDYKEPFYRAYHSTHVVPRKGPASLQQFKLRARIYDANWSHLIPPDRRRVILDIGCGGGSLLWWLQQRGYVSASGIDLSAEQIQVASELGVKNIEVGDLAEYLSRTPGRHDVLILRDVLEHLERPRIVEAVELCRDALRPGGIVLAQVPNAEAPFWGRIRHGDFTHELAFTEASLRQLFTTVGYTSVEVHPAGPVRVRLTDIPRQALWRCLEAVYKVMAYAETGRRWPVVTESIIALARLDKLSGQP